MYWLGRRAGLSACHDVVRVETADGTTAFFGRRQWSTVRVRLGCDGLVTLPGFWRRDRPAAERLADGGGEERGGRFVALNGDELHEALEGLLPEA